MKIRIFVSMKGKYPANLERFAGGKLLIFGYLLILLLGYALLCLPFSQRESIGSLDNLFIATSALSTTGLATLTIGESYTVFGQLVILLLIQIGGIGYMSLGSAIIIGRRNSLSAAGLNLLRLDFSLPDNYDIVAFVKNVVAFSFLIEFIGVLLLLPIFYQAGVPAPIWNAVFHSISAFCTAGFSLFSNGFESYTNHFGLNAVIGILSFCGAIGFIVFSDVYQNLWRKDSRTTYTSRIILRFTFSIFLLGTFLLLITDPGLAVLAPEERLLAAAFQSMTALTTVGFNTYPIGALAASPLFLLTLIMVMGASPSGTGGGIKSTTITALYAQTRATLQGKSQASYLNRTIPQRRIHLALSNFFFYIFILAIGIYLLFLTENAEPFAIIFEATSALGTVGLSTGLTGSLTILGKVVITLLMFLGRIGPLSLGVALLGEAETADSQALREGDIAI
jgi:trk system potassium uptake protein TrkH